MRPRVLVVDDEPDFLELVDFSLSGQGFEVVRAATGLEALHKARCEAPVVIVLDMMLPDLDGFSVCEILRSQPSTRNVPVIVLSALEAPGERPRRSRFKVAHWLKKGVDMAVLGQCVRGALGEQSESPPVGLDAEEPARPSPGC